jgi:hypothetical protein
MARQPVREEDHLRRGFEDLSWEERCAAIEWQRANGVGLFDGQAPVASETPATARERVSTPALGVETMEQVVRERLR